MAMHSFTSLTPPSHPFGDDNHRPRNISCRCMASRPNGPKTFSAGPQRSRRNCCSSIDTETHTTTSLTSCPGHNEVPIDSAIGSFLDWPGILRDVETELSGAILREKTQRNGQTKLAERCDKTNEKASLAERLELRTRHNDWSAGSKPSSDQALLPSLKPCCDGVADIDSEPDLVSDCELDDYGISGIDDEAAAKRRELTYRTDLAPPVEQCLASCCDYRDVSCSDCETERIDAKSFEAVKGCGDSRRVTTKLGGNGHLRLV